MLVSLPSPNAGQSRGPFCALGCGGAGGEVAPRGMALGRVEPRPIELVTNIRVIPIERYLILMGFPKFSPAARLVLCAKPLQAAIRRDRGWRVYEKEQCWNLGMARTR